MFVVVVATADLGWWPVLKDLGVVLIVVLVDSCVYEFALCFFSF